MKLFGKSTGSDEKTERKFGRRMVKTLGLSTAVGVLLIGAIFGYRTAMEKNFADNFVYTLNLYVPEMIQIVNQEDSLVAAHIKLAHLVNRDPFKKDFAQYLPYGCYTNVNESAIMLYMDGINKSDCDMLSRHAPTTPTTDQLYLTDIWCGFDSSLTVIIPYIKKEN